jgi:hypothetical protein
MYFSNCYARDRLTHFVTVGWIRWSWRTTATTSSTTATKDTMADFRSGIPPSVVRRGEESKGVREEEKDDCDEEAAVGA